MRIGRESRGHSAGKEMKARGGKSGPIKEGELE